MFRLIFIIGVLLISLIITDEVDASVTYTPGATIAMTGSNSDVRFDVASTLYASGITNMNPRLIISTQFFTGAFYVANIGWIEFASGSNQVRLSCSQDISELTSNCSLTGTGWSENVGDVDFSQVRYNYTTGLLEGTGTTYAGDISLAGITLPLRPITLDQTSLTANHAATLTVSGAWMYDAGDKGWNGTIITGLDSQAISGISGRYNLVDFSMASNYTIKIRDTNDSETIISDFIVSPGVPSTTLETSYYAQTFCASNPLDINCPDGVTRSVTTLIQSPPAGPVVANGTDAYSFTLKARDKYGNRVETGAMKITYTTTVKNIQTDISENTNYGPSLSGDAFISSVLGTGLGGSVESTFPLNTSDITYSISSTAPTNNTGNKIQLDSIVYKSGALTIPISNTTPPLTFSPLYTASVSAGAPTVNIPHLFTVEVVENGTILGVTPTIISTLKIGDGTSADEWKTLSSNPTETCVNYPNTSTTDILCDWGDVTNPVSSIATISNATFTFTGTYTSSSTNPKNTTIKNYIYYKNGANDILYEGNRTDPISANMANQRVHILGQSSESIGGEGINRVNLLNDIRKQVSLLSRNRTDYSSVEYNIIATGSNQTIYNTSFDSNKRTIVVIGTDINIAENIEKRDHPLAVIALADAGGNGGNIIINGSVTDINSSLIAERTIKSSNSDHQLYIYGSISSTNPPRESTPTTCPYFETNCSQLDNFDLPKMRSGFLLAPTNKSIGGGIYPTPIVIEMDPRLLIDTPPAMYR